MLVVHMVEVVVEMVHVGVVVYHIVGPSGAYQEVVDGRSVGQVDEVVLGKSQDVAFGNLCGNRLGVGYLRSLVGAPTPVIRGVLDPKQCGVTETKHNG
jgi:hypothetical protein